MIKALILDMDGVIVDSEPIHYEVSMRIFEELGLNISEEEYLSFVGTTNDEIFERLKSRYKIRVDVDEQCELYARRYAEKIRNCPLEAIDGVTELIRETKRNGLSLALASSSTKQNIQIILGFLKFEPYFDVIVSGDDVEKPKPFPDIFLRAAEQMNVRPSECIVIEDSGNGVKAAKAAEMKCIGYRNYNSGEQDLSLADLVVDSFRKIDLKEIVAI